MTLRAALVLVLLALWPSAALAAQPRTTLGDVEDEAMCVECGTPLNLSQAPSADRERALIRREIAKGRTKDQIKRKLVAEYGRGVLADPPNRGFDAANWLVPVVLAAFALLALAVTARRWRRASAAAPEPDAGPRLAPEDESRLERDMAGYDL